MARKGWVIPLALLLIGVAASIEALRLGLGSMRRPGVGFLPLLVGACLSLLALFSLVTDIAAARRAKGKEKLFGPRVVKVAAVICCLGLYVALLPFAGYFLTTFLLFIVLFKTGGVQRWGPTLAASLLTACISYLVFGFWLGIRFPKGFWGV